MAQPSISPSFSDYRTVGEAAAFLGISAATLRNWDRSGKLKPRRHPQNGYRIYLHEDLVAVLRSADLSRPAEESSAPVIDWSEMGEDEHFVQFYESDDFLVTSVSGFVGAALREGNASVIIATAPHGEAIQHALGTAGVDVDEAVATGRFVILDAAETLSRIVVDGAPDPERVRDLVGGMMTQLGQGDRRIHAFGEMVALLWAGGKRDAAIRLENLWNEMRRVHRFAIFCAYPLFGFGSESDAAGFEGICECHTRVIPAESYAGIGSRNQRLRAITSLQQKAQSLAAEIAHRQQVEKDLSDRERELADFFENAIEGLRKVGPDGTVMWANQTEYALLGYTAAEYIGRRIADFHVDADVATDIQERLGRGETLENYPVRLRCKDGSIRQLLMNANACFRDGQLVYGRCLSRDVTRQQEAEKALADANRRKDEFLATLAHELRNPLAPIRNAVELMRLDGPRGDGSDETLQVVDRQTRQLTRLVDDLLDVSRITRDELPLHKERVELSAVIASAIETSGPLIEAAGHTLTVSLPRVPVLLQADPFRLAQLFANLLNNSAKYTNRGGRIAIEVQTDEREVAVTVRDNGIGISGESLAFLFDMFWQANRTLNRAQGGLGIGLTLVRRLAEMHGGTVQAQSEGLGKGSQFVVRLPLAGAALGDAVACAPGPRTVSSRRMLVVDDNLDSIATLKGLLQHKGNDVRVAHDGVEAVAIAEEFRPDVILMDVGMPNMNGYEATRQIRQKPWGKEMFIVALSGWGQVGDVRQSVEAGCSAHLVKPADFAALEQLLASRQTSNS
ncbi:MAG TPA: ATP-binding protein [Planctomycetaceae bacterium]|jgi:PAS domain S-box-containing protein|nr:ATP-binding protein [Planctomycetaceae bacterium]